MEENKGKAKDAFAQALSLTANSETVVPDMVRRDQPVQRPKPPSMAQAVDKRLFDQQWREEIKKHRNIDPFEQIDYQKRQRLTDIFNSRSRGRER